MPLVIIVGAQWGDEGKGKIVDMLAERVNLVARFSGGSNAGHTVCNPYGEFKLHLIPSGIFYPHTTCVIGNGVVVSPTVLLHEIEQLEAKGITVSRLYISTRAHVVMPYHNMLDALEEQSKGAGALGTTKNGVGPAYMDKAARLGIRVGDLLEREDLKDRLRSVLEHKNRVLTRVYGADPLSLDDVYQQCCEYADRLSPFIADTGPILRSALARGETVLMEGAQGTLLDLDFGTYPYVTSSSPSVGGAFSGLGLSPARHKVDYLLGILKAYCTRVGSGPMPTELEDQTGMALREKGNEYGSTTGRPRRCGWFDAVAARFSVEVNGFTGFALTRLDVLDTFPLLKICTGYRVDGTLVDSFPSSIAALERCEPIYEELPGWQCSTTRARRLTDLPDAARRYISRLEELTSCPVDLISVGPKREETIVIKGLPQLAELRR